MRQCRGMGTAYAASLVAVMCLAIVAWLLSLAFDVLKEHRRDRLSRLLRAYWHMPIYEDIAPLFLKFMDDLSVDSIAYERQGKFVRITIGISWWARPWLGYFQRRAIERAGECMKWARYYRGLS